MPSITGVGESLHKVLAQIGSKLWSSWHLIAPIDLQWGKCCSEDRAFIIPQQNRVWGGILFSACPSFRPSVILWFRQHLSILLYNLDSFCPILFIFTPQHYCQTMHDWKIGAEGSVLQELCHFVNLSKMFVLWLIVILSTRVLLYNFDSFCLILFVLTPYHYNQTMHVW